MSELHFGTLLSAATGDIQFTLAPGMVFIWRDGSTSEGVLIESIADVPPSWQRDILIPWKIFGRFDVVKSLFPGFRFPMGTKVIGLRDGALLRAEFSRRSMSFSGVREKRVLVVEDSPTIRKLIRHTMTGFDGWSICAEVERAEDIPAALEEHYPDILTLDLNLPGLNGVEAMKRFLAPKQFPTILVTSQPKADGGLVMDALDAGAIDYLQKPESGKLGELKNDLLIKMEAALRSKWHLKKSSGPVRRVSSAGNFDPDKFLIVIGSSTGGTQALLEIFTRLPERIPPILVTQHIPAGFSRSLAMRLNDLCPFEVKEAEDNDVVRAGRILIAPGDHHLSLSAGGKSVEIISSEPINRFRPSVEFMFRSVAKVSGRTVIAVMLTGMGKDGAEAMLELRNNGAITVAQDEASSVVFGMPKEAIRIGAAAHVKGLGEIPEFLMSLLSQTTRKIG
jgi:two-component system chemotaxis response regulator CheB